jgi:hypothetical protein
MKIIATMGTNKYLAEVSLFELRELNNDIKVEVGAEYEIRKAAETLAHIGKYIKNLQSTFDEIEESYDALMLLDKIKNSEENDN